MIKNSKAQGLSLNTIVIAAIVLVVLFILVGMTTGYFGKWGPKFSTVSETSCRDSGGNVVAKTATCNSDEKDDGGFYDDVKEDQKCCLKKTCEELGGSCCVSGSNVKRSNDPGCIARNKQIPNCCG